MQEKRKFQDQGINEQNESVSGALLLKNSNHNGLVFL
jgi:hypothetical protein